MKADPAGAIMTAMGWLGTEQDAASKIRRIDPVPPIDAEANKPIEERTSVTETYLMTRAEAYKFAKIRSTPADMVKHRRMILGSRWQRIIRWLRGI